MPLLIVSRERAFTPAAAQALDKPIVMIQSGIHAGEIDGKEASLLLLREIALGGAPELLDAATLLIVPIYNVDGHEQSSPLHRPNQDGPRRGMGRRTTRAGYDLNRDHMKLESVEARALVGLVNAWRPHLHVDNHVTNGSDHAWEITFSWAEAPQLASPLAAWQSHHLPPILEQLDARGHPCGPYVDLVDPIAPEKGFSSWIESPRFSTQYFALRQRLSILVETHSHKPFRTRVAANRDFLELLLREIGRDPRGLIAAVQESEQQVVSAGRPDAAPSRVALRYELSDVADRQRLPLYAHHVERSLVSGKPLLLYDSATPQPRVVPWYHTAQVAQSATRPRGYLILPGWPEVEAKLLGHGLRVVCLTRPTAVDVEALIVDKPVFATSSYQGRHRVSAQTTRQREARTVPAGTLFVPADQPDFEVAVQLLEPDAPDSLLSWGLLSTALEPKEWIDGFILERWVRAQLQQPETAKAWRAALRDPRFATDSEARFDWWFRRHPSFDPELGRLPILRLLSPLP